MQKNHELTSSVITRANSLPYIHSQMVLPDSVTGIAAEAFMKRNCIESIHMPMHLQRIGLRAFSGCFGLTSVRIPISTVVIEPEAFSRCLSLEKVSLPASLSVLPASIFSEDTALQSLTFRGTAHMKRIDEMACYGCRSLSTVTLPSTVQTIETQAFYGCKSLEEIQLPASLTEIGEKAFSTCGLVHIKLPDGLEYLGRQCLFPQQASDVCIHTVQCPPSR